MVITSTATHPDEKDEHLSSTFASRYVRQPIPKYVSFSHTFSCCLLVHSVKETESRKKKRGSLMSIEMRFLCCDGVGVEMLSAGSRCQIVPYQRMLLIS